MKSLKEFTLKNYDCKVPSVNKTIFWDTFGLANTPECPTNKTIDAMKMTGVTTESVSEVKELENVSNITGSNILREDTKPTRHSKFRSKIPKRIIKADVKKPTHAIQHQDDSAPSLLDGLRRCSSSEPSFDNIKGHEDDIGLPDDCREGISKVDSERRPSDRKLLLPKERILKGCIFIKNEGNVYKSAVEAKALNVYEKDGFANFPHDRSSTSKNKLVQNVHGKNGLNSQTAEASDFEITIYLSGFVSGNGERNKQHMKDLGNMQQKECQVQYTRGQKKKKSHDSESNAVYDKSCEIVNQARPNVSILQKGKKGVTGTSSYCKTRQTYQINKQNVALDIAGDDSDAEYELDEHGSIVPKRKTEENLENNSIDVSNSAKENYSGQLSYRSRKSTLMSQSSLSCYSNGFMKSKVTEEYMWENFEAIFKK